MSSTLFERARPFGQTFLQSWGAVLRRGFRALRHHGEKRRAADHLMACPDHLLRDIGINRRRIAAAIQGPLDDPRGRHASR